MFTRVRGLNGSVTQRCHYSPRWETWLASSNDIMHRKHAEDFGNLKKVRRVENWTPDEKGWLSLARGGLGQVSHEMGGRWKSQNRKIVPLSPYVEKPLDSKVMKSFVPELRSRKCFSYFEIPMFYVYIYIYIWTLYVHFAYAYLAMEY